MLQKWRNSKRYTCCYAFVLKQDHRRRSLRARSSGIRRREFCSTGTVPTFHRNLLGPSSLMGMSKCLAPSIWRQLVHMKFFTCLRNYTTSYLLTPWCRVHLEKLTGFQPAKKFPAIHGTRRFITALTSLRHLTLSWTSSIQSIYPHPTSWRSVLVLSTHLCLGLPSGLLPSSFPTKTLHIPSPHPYAPHAQPILFFSILSPAQYLVRCTNHLAPRYAISSIPPLPRPS